MTDMTKWGEPQLIELWTRCHKYNPKTTAVGALAEQALNELERRGRLHEVDKRTVDAALEQAEENAQN